MSVKGRRLSGVGVVGAALVTAAVSVLLFAWNGGASAQGPETETFVWVRTVGDWPDYRRNLTKLTTDGVEVFKRYGVEHEGMALDPRDGSSWMRSEDPWNEYWEMTAKVDHCGYVLHRVPMPAYSGTAVDPNDGSVWIGLANEREMVKLDQYGEELFRRPLPVDGYPQALDVDPLDGSVWLGLSYVPALSKLDSEGNLLFSEVVVGFSSDGQRIAVDPRNSRVWTATRYGVSRRDADGTNLVQVPGFSRPTGVVVDSRDGSVWVADRDLGGTGMVVKLDEHGSESLRFSLGTPPEGIGVDPQNGSVWVGIEGELVRLSSLGVEELRIPMEGRPTKVEVATIPVLACRPDTDGDLVPDEEDVCPSDPMGWYDSDGDGVCNGTDNCADIPNPGQENEDGDVLGDACEWPDEPVFKNGYDLHPELQRDIGASVGRSSRALFINNSGQIAGDYQGLPLHEWSGAFSWTPGEGAVDLGTLGGTYMSVSDLNESGQIVGHGSLAPDWSHAFIWSSEEGLRDLAVNPSLSSEALCLNNVGEVAGRFQPDPQSFSPFYWSEEMGHIELPVSVPGPVWQCEARDINDLGQVAVTCSDWDMTVSYVWSNATGMTLLPTPGDSTVWVAAMNNQGEVVGMQEHPTGESNPFLWTAAGGMEDLGNLGGSYGHANDINERGEVAGMSYTSDWRFHPFLWSRETGMVDLTLGFDGPPVDWGYIHDMSEVAVIGCALMDGWYDHHAFLWTQEDGFKDLGTLGGIISSGHSVNDYGQAVGWAQNDFNITPWEGENHAVLWLPDEPPTPEEQTEALVAEVQNLIDTGVLNQGNGNALTTKLENALGKLEKGNTQAACNEMGAFVNLVEAFVNSGKLTEEEGQPLVEGAGSLIAELCGAG
jgi:probable HAF family extracellular repeat protein